MPGLGTIVNVLAIVAGGIIGLTAGRFLTDRQQNGVIMACGLSTIFLGLSGALSRILTYSDGRFDTQGSMMMIGSLVLGSLIGELLGIEDRLETFGEWLKMKTGSTGDKGFVNAFVTASLTVCIGAMAVVGSIQDGIAADHSVLFTKAILDFVIIIIMAGSMGKGSVFSAVSVGIFQGSITLLSRLLIPVMTDGAMANLSLVGNILIFCVGINLCFGKKFRVGNYLPGLVIAVAWAFLPF